MDLTTLRAFRDEFEKIAVEGGEAVQAPQTSAPAAAPPPVPEKELAKRDYIEAKAREYAERIRAAAKHDQMEPARKANNLFGLPVAEPPIRKVKKYQDQGSAAATMPDQSQAGAGGQSTANISAGNQMSPATGPGGV